MIGSTGARQAVFILQNDGGVTLREVTGRLSATEIRSAQSAVVAHFDALVVFWKEYR